MKKILFFFLPFLLVSCASKPVLENQVEYMCGETKVRAKYWDNDTVQIKAGKNKFRLNATIAASGAKYEDIEKKNMFWSKGGSAQLEINGKPYPTCERIIP